MSAAPRKKFLALAASGILAATLLPGCIFCRTTPLPMPFCRADGPLHCGEVQRVSKFNSLDHAICKHPRNVYFVDVPWNVAIPPATFATKLKTEIANRAQRNWLDMPSGFISSSATTPTVTVEPVLTSTSWGPDQQRFLRVRFSLLGRFDGRRGGQGNRGPNLAGSGLPPEVEWQLPVTATKHCLVLEALRASVSAAGGLSATWAEQVKIGAEWCSVVPTGLIQNAMAAPDASTSNWHLAAIGASTTRPTNTVHRYTPQCRPVRQAYPRVQILDSGWELSVIDRRSEQACLLPNNLRNVGDQRQGVPLSGKPHPHGTMSKFTHALQNLLNLLKVMSKFTHALQNLLNLLKVMSKFAHALQNLLNLLKFMSKFTHALQNLLNLLKVMSKFTHALQNLLNLLKVMSKFAHGLTVTDDSYECPIEMRTDRKFPAVEEVRGTFYFYFFFEVLYFQENCIGKIQY